jgi:hypothetical protein
MAVARPPTSTSTDVVIQSRFCGPPDSANGGYTCGIVAGFLGAPVAEVTLLLPPPLSEPMTLERAAEGARLVHDDRLIAAGAAIDGLELAVPAAVGLAEAESAMERSPLHHTHPFPGCFVCGPRRAGTDGLGIVPGPVEGRELVAAPWRPDEALADEHGGIATEISWAALDCPSGHALMLLDDVGTAVLGRLAVRFLLEIEPGRAYVAAGWPLARDGRKIDSASALFTERGEPAALARARWIELRTAIVT